MEKNTTSDSCPHGCKNARSAWIGHVKTDFKKCPHGFNYPKEEVTKPARKVSAADIDALRWRQMFQDFASAKLAACPSADKKLSLAILREAEFLTDEGMKIFYNRYEKET